MHQHVFGFRPPKADWDYMEDRIAHSEPADGTSAAT